MDISAQVKELRELADDMKKYVGLRPKPRILRESADTIESLSAKLQAANMERSAEDCGGRRSWKNMRGAVIGMEEAIKDINKALKERVPDGIKEKTLIMAVEALEKQIPKKPLKQTDKYSDLVEHYYCPSCGRYFGQRGVHNAILFNKERYCQDEGCGQALDWSEE